MMEESKPTNAPKQLNSSGALSYLKHLDIYTKVDEEFKVQTSTGAFLSLCSWVVIALLIFGELQSYFQFHVKEHMIVDTNLGEHLRININITFHALTCNEVHLDAMDVAGDNQLNIENSIFKQRISQDGFLIGDRLESGSDSHSLSAESLPADYCGPCYGAESTEIKCCNTCNDLRNAYDRRGWAFTEQLLNTTQCIREKMLPFEHVQKGEGCTVTGTMTVNKVAGNFHVAHGESIVRDGRHIHQFIPSEAPSFNSSHTINEISFGDPYPNMPKNPLDSTMRIVDTVVGTGLFQYFIRVIPTIFTDEYGYKHFTNQYTTSERFRPLTLPSESGEIRIQNTVLPGIFFVYEVSPFLIEVQRISSPFSHLFAKICAIVGGVLTISGVLDSCVYRIQKLLF